MFVKLKGIGFRESSRVSEQFAFIANERHAFLVIPWGRG